jgi:hypothetical protein
MISRDIEVPSADTAIDSVWAPEVCGWCLLPRQWILGSPERHTYFVFSGFVCLVLVIVVSPAACLLCSGMDLDSHRPHACENVGEMGEGFIQGMAVGSWIWVDIDGLGLKADW